MSASNLSVQERIENLRELLSFSGRMYTWVYNLEGEVQETNCPDLVLHKVFKKSGYLERMLEHAREHSEPIVFSVPMGLMWGAAFERGGDAISNIHVFGPASSTELSIWAVDDALRRAEMSPGRRKKLEQILMNIPTVSTVDFFRYILMLHYCVTGEKLTNSDIVFISQGIEKPASGETTKRDRMKTYMTEQALMRMVSEGDLNYKSILDNAAGISRGVRVDDNMSLRQVRVSQIVFISLCTRAAIEGGISPEVAYSRGDAYIQDVLDCKSVTDAAQIGHTMYDDFVRLVHKSRSNPKYSKQIQSCCEYIELNAEKKITLKDLARHVGYVEYYLSRKFKEETGFSINDYIKIVKVEHAKTLLISSDMGIQEICDKLGFGSRSFFAETFKEITGLPPARFREQNRRM